MSHKEWIFILLSHGGVSRWCSWEVSPSFFRDVLLAPPRFERQLPLKTSDSFFVRPFPRETHSVLGTPRMFVGGSCKLHPKKDPERGFHKSRSRRLYLKEVFHGSPRVSQKKRAFHETYHHSLFSIQCSFLILSPRTA